MAKADNYKENLEKHLEEFDERSKKLLDMMAKNRTYPFCSKKGKIFFRGVKKEVYPKQIEDEIIDYFGLQTKEDCDELREIAKQRAEELRTTYPIREWSETERPREKLIKHGSEFLSNTELFAALLGKGYAGKNALQLAGSTLAKYQAKNLPKLSYKELVQEKGIGKAAACRILAAFELSTRLLLEQEEDAVVISTPKDVYNLLKEMGNYKKEHFVGLYLNARNQLVHKETISIGTLNANIVHPREVFNPAVKYHAASVILVHNHPSGSPESSKSDLEITKKITKAGKIMDIDVLDHVIITKSKVFSFKKRKLI